MKEAGYPILYHLNLILRVSSHLAPDVIHKRLKSLRDSFKGSWTWPRSSNLPCFHAFMLKPLLHNCFVEQKGCKWNVMRAGGLYKGSALCETFYNRSPGCKPIEIVLKAPLKPEIKLSGAIWMAFWQEEELKWGRKQVSARNFDNGSTRVTTY